MFWFVGLAVFTGVCLLTRVGCGRALRGFRIGPIEPGSAGEAWGVVGGSGGVIGMPGFGSSV